MGFGISSQFNYVESSKTYHFVYILTSYLCAIDVILCGVPLLCNIVRMSYDVM